jgi:hypothetical protein
MAKDQKKTQDKRSQDPAQHLSDPEPEALLPEFLKF